jgi:hypothetical protein
MSPIDEQPRVPDPMDFHDNPDPIASVPRDSMSGLLVAIFAAMVVLAVIAITVLEKPADHALTEPPAPASALHG